MLCFKNVPMKKKCIIRNIRAHATEICFLHVVDLETAEIWYQGSWQKQATTYSDTESLFLGAICQGKQLK